MMKSLVLPTHELTISIASPVYHTLQTRAKEAGRSEAEMAAQVLSLALNPPPIAPWNRDLIRAIETVLNQYFEGLPRVLDRLTPQDDHPGVFRL